MDNGYGSCRTDVRAQGAQPGSQVITSTRFTDLVGCELPLQLAAMGGVGTTELAAAVASAGGFGMLPDGTEPADGPCGVNLLMPFEPSLDDVSAAAGRLPPGEFFLHDPP